jgi:hypothetical protein
MNLAASFVGIGASALSLVNSAEPIKQSVIETALRSRFVQTEFHVVWTLGDRAHPRPCGLVHVGAEGDRIPYNDTLFIVLGGRAYTPQDVLPDQFLKWGKQFCGPDWVAPHYIAPIS